MYYIYTGLVTPVCVCVCGGGGGEMAILDHRNYPAAAIKVPCMIGGFNMMWVACKFLVEAINIHGCAWECTS